MSKVSDVSNVIPENVLPVIPDHISSDGKKDRASPSIEGDADEPEENLLQQKTTEGEEILISREAEEEKKEDPRSPESSGERRDTFTSGDEVKMKKSRSFEKDEQAVIDEVRKRKIDASRQQRRRSKASVPNTSFRVNNITDEMRKKT